MHLTQIQQALMRLGFNVDPATNVYCQVTNKGKISVHRSDNSPTRGLFIEGPGGIVVGNPVNEDHMHTMLVTAGY
ncbi:hypothetical protein [Hymenobacter jejuensis]|uniref:Uncharacterized protein n=1 Tax=Hymenobacter jejuensis TaxID=2502781 RepID=A0A5B8A4H1_9BACT|nr:hypothetical protein [Hymenobacter jejuensis]QDA62157.1 hypothetical protein FHG12_19550 [Hymenobacter jejuensis]